MHCNNCGSDSVRKFSVICEEGTYAENTSTKARVSGSDTTIRGESSTIGTSKLAKTCAPPEKKKPISDFFLASFGFLLVSLIIAGLGHWLIEMSSLGYYSFAIFTVINIRASIKQFKFNRTKYPILKEEWNNSWFCLKCGEQFIAKN